MHASIDRPTRKSVVVKKDVAFFMLPLLGMPFFFASIFVDLRRLPPDNPSFDNSLTTALAWRLLPVRKALLYGLITHGLLRDDVARALQI